MWTWHVPIHVFGDKHQQLSWCPIAIIIMSNTPKMPTVTTKKARKARQDCKYTPEEQATIRPYKDEYQSQTTSPGWGHIFRTKILPAIFNYWRIQLGTIWRMKGRYKIWVQCEVPVLIWLQALGAWLANNWHPKTTKKATKSQQRITKVDVMWRHYWEAVETQMKEILGVDELDPLATAYFQQWNAAAREAYNQLTEPEKQTIEHLKEKYKLEPNLLEVQQKYVFNHCW